VLQESGEPDLGKGAYFVVVSRFEAEAGLEDRNRWIARTDQPPSMARGTPVLRNATGNGNRRQLEPASSVSQPKHHSSSFIRRFR
jgi:hypothetical protein